ncbi:hypothetical protein QR680_001027 [Steinernema hermaphroditum]|uniref:ShKT domain-containing protein n=1 Tax=Steinernema hermaphroditum TaxID=289476 RepID=A0AA39LF53_9BILA|nr:hypothetical protein QR680_001027 [Steinernema hermaphroditum]
MFVFFLLVFLPLCCGSPDVLKAACARNPELSFCRSTTVNEPFPELMREEREQEYEKSVKKDFVGPNGPCMPCSPHYPRAEEEPQLPPPPPPFPDSPSDAPFFAQQPPSPLGSGPPHALAAGTSSNPFGFDQADLARASKPLGDFLQGNPFGFGKSAPNAAAPPQISNPLGGSLPIPANPFGNAGPALPNLAGAGSLVPNPLGIGAPQIPVAPKASEKPAESNSFVFGVPPPGDRGPLGPFQAPPGGKVPPPRPAVQDEPPTPEAAPPPPNDRSANSPELQALCKKFESIVKEHCHGAQTESFYAPKCAGYFKDCGGFISQQNAPAPTAKKAAPPPKPAAPPKDFTSGVDLNYGSAAVKGIPFYPINEEGSVEAARTGKVGYGSWGGGYSDQVGVRDYWSQHAEYGANVKEGKFGYQNGWSVPLVQSLGVEGGGGTAVSVPTKKEDIGKKPIDVDTGYGVGGYYKQNDHVGVDWKRGDVSHNFGVGVPFAGVGFNQGVGVHFPSMDTFLSKLTP